MEEQLLQETHVDLNNEDMEQAKIAKSSSELRIQARQYLTLARTETNLRIRTGLAGCAFALSQLAESVDRGRGGILR